MMTPEQARLYRRLIARGYVPYLARPRVLANALRAAFGLPAYRVLGGWLPPRAKAA